MSPQGTIEGGFEQVREVFAAQLTTGGAALAVLVDGRPVVDLWGGSAGPGRAWERDTLVSLASATKAIPAVAAHLLVARGLLDLDAPVRAYWPEFAAAGKENMTVRSVLGHRSGLVTTPRMFTLQDQHDHAPIVDALAAHAPDWEPDTAHGYHAFTFGWIISELVRRVTGEPVGPYFAREVAGPQGLDLHIGLPATEFGRMATVHAPTEEQLARGLADPAYARFNAALSDPSTLLHRATFGTTAVRFDDVNDPALYAAPDPSGGGFGTAAGLAGLYAAITTGLLDPAVLAAPQSDGEDRVLQLHTRWGLGFMLPGGPMWPDFGAPAAFGHAGASGALGFADPDTGIAFGYVPNAMTGLTEGTDERAAELIAAVYTALNAPAGSTR